MKASSSVLAELPKIRKRWLVNPFADAAPKEWWYAGCHDPETGTYFSFFFFRMPLLDAARVTLFDPSAGEVRELGWKGGFQATESDGGLSIEISDKDLRVVYRRVDDGNWRFTMAGRGWDVDLEICRNLSAFARHEDRRGVASGIVHWMGNEATGRILAHGAQYRYRRARGYCDHAWGLVARRVGWHWFAVQSDKFCLVSLVNTGEVAQTYTQILVRGDADRSQAPGWIRLDPQVVFGRDPQGRWNAVSTEMEVEIASLQETAFRERIPPVFPFLVDIHHRESLVSVAGRVRIDGIWQDIGDLFGVMEVHRGTW